jgi:hypothetical protein
MIMTKYVDRIVDLVFRRPIWRGSDVSEWAAPVVAIGQTCRGCGKRAQLELTNDESDRVEYLCYEDLGPFLEIFVDPGVREWTVVRL